MKRILGEQRQATGHRTLRVHGHPLAGDRRFVRETAGLAGLLKSARQMTRPNGLVCFSILVTKKHGWKRQPARNAAVGSTLGTGKAANSICPARVIYRFLTTSFGLQTGCSGNRGPNINAEYSNIAASTIRIGF